MKKLLTLLPLVLLSGFLFSQSRNIHGKVINQAGETLPGTLVLIKGTRKGTTTNTDGKFSLEIPDTTNALVFDYLGYAPQEVVILGLSLINVQLEESTNVLDEILVVGFGTQKKRRVTSSIVSVDKKVFEQIPVPNFQRALQGRMPGVVITNASGGLNAEAVIRIRGTGSISAGNQPIIVVDGLTLASVSDNDLGYDTNPYIGLNPNDIASVEVLKDAAATAIYGSRGSNGVILISTKSGSFNQAPKVSLGYYGGFSEISKRRDLLHTKEYVEIWNEAAENVGYDRATDPGWFYDVGTEPYADWQNLLLRKGFVQEANVNVSGGTPTSKYYFGASMRDEDSYLQTIGLKRYSVRANMVQMIGDKVTAGISINPSRTIDNRTGNQWAGSAWGAASWYAPVFEALDDNGDCRRDILLSSNGKEGGFAGNPCTVLKDTWIQTTTTHVLFHPHLHWSPIDNLILKTELGVEVNQVHRNRRIGASTWFGSPSGEGAARTQHVFNYNWTNLATWQNNWSAGHELMITAGMHLTKETLDRHNVWGDNFFDDRLRYLEAAALTGGSSFRTEATFLGYLSRVNYAFQNKYYLSLSGRYDGSSRFGSGNRYGFFPAASAGWVISDEGFFDIQSINFLKLRSSIGLSGNAEIGNFASRGLVSFDPAYVGESGYVIQSIENDALGWEKNSQWDAGLEFSLLNNRLSGSIEYYIKDTKDLLLDVPIPATNGISVLTSNVGEVRNQGFEFELSADILIGAFGWSLGLNGATLKNEVKKLADQDGDGLDDDIIFYGRMLFRPGESIGTYYLVEYAGVDPNNGDALFYDLEGSKVANDASSDHRKITGNSLPSFSGGFTNRFRYKNFDLSAFFHFKTGHKIYMLDRNREGSFSGGNMHKNILNRWTPDNTSTDVPQVRLYENNGAQGSTRYLESGNFLRLQNLNLGYTFQDIGTMNAKLRIFAGAQNLLTFTNFRGLDPDSEFRSSGEAATGTVHYNLPSSKTYIMGFNIDF